MKIIKVKDYYGHIQEVPVDDAFYAEWVKLNNESRRSFRRTAYHRSGVPSDKADSYVTYDYFADLSDDLIKEELNAYLYEAIASLTPIQQRRVLLFMENMSYSDIARKEGIKFAPVYRSLQAAFKKLRILLADYYYD